MRKTDKQLLIGGPIIVLLLIIMAICITSCSNGGGSEIAEYAKLKSNEMEAKTNDTNYQFVDSIIQSRMAGTPKEIVEYEGLTLISKVKDLYIYAFNYEGYQFILCYEATVYGTNRSPTVSITRF